MSFTLDDWHDFLRLILIGLSIYCVFVLVARYRSSGKNEWNTKTRDHWFSALMWSIAGGVYFTQGIFLDRPFTVAYVFMTAAVLTSGKALARRGQWGGSA